MNLIQIIQNEYITFAIFGVIGGIITWFTQGVLNGGIGVSYKFTIVLFQSFSLNQYGKRG